MKPIINLKEEEQKTFPALYQHNGFGFIVLFTSENTGVIVSPTTCTEEEDKESYNSYKIGVYSKTWSPYNYKGEWKRLPTGSIIELIQE